MTLVDERAALRTADLAFSLPAELIAQEPLAERDSSRLMVLPKGGGKPTHATMRDLPELLRPGDLLVANNSRVLSARLRAEKTQSGGKVELLLLAKTSNGTWRALAKPSRRLRIGTELLIHPRSSRYSAGGASIESIEDAGAVTVRLSDAVNGNLEAYGEMPLPPYITAPLGDQERYQTVYAAPVGSAAAPTAGLHVTAALLERIRAAGIGWAEVTLHVGLDTFRPMTSEFVADHPIHSEWCHVSDETARKIAETRTSGGRVIAVGTTSARTLESLGSVFDDAHTRGWSGETDIFITPGYRWRLVDGLLTNFHLPHSTLLAMVSALVGWDRLRGAYEEAIAERYRFFSFGDAMLIT